MSQEFELAGGSMIGRDHRAVPKNNQDSWAVWQSDESTVAIVADGCGSGKYSEVGSRIGANVLGEYLYKECTDPLTINWRRAQQTLLSHLDIVARGMGGDYRQTVQDYFLFTLVGVVIGKERAVFFALGDGRIVINGVHTLLGPFPENMPPYIGYNLVADNVSLDPSSLQLRPYQGVLTADLQSFLIATDGVEDIIRSESRCKPGLERKVSPLSDFWQNDRYFKGNPEILARELKLIGRDWPHEQPEPGLLSDDTTIVVGRRRLEEKG